MANPPAPVQGRRASRWRVPHSRPWSVGIVDKIRSAPGRLMSHEPSGYMAWAIYPAVLHAWAPDAGSSFVATL